METTGTNQTTGEEVRERETAVTTGIPRLDAMIRKGSWAELGSMYGCLALARHDSQLGDKMLALLRSQLRVFFKDPRPEKDSDGDLLDAECEVMPVVEWLAMVDGLKAAGRKQSAIAGETSMVDTSSDETEPEGDPHVKTIKRWLQNRSYSEKLAAVILWQLTSKECHLEEPDNRIGNTLFRQWEKEVVTKSGDSEYLESAPADEVAVTAATTIMLPWHV